MLGPQSIDVTQFLSIFINLSISQNLQLNILIEPLFEV